MLGDRIRTRCEKFLASKHGKLHSAVSQPLAHAFDRHASIYDVKHHLRMGPSPDAVDPFGRTALHLAAQYNHAHLIPALVTATNLNYMEQGPFEATPLMVAAAAGSTQAVEALLAAGADIRCCTSSGHTALGKALTEGKCAAALLLWEHAQLCTDCEYILAAAIKGMGPALNSESSWGATPLAMAARKGYHQLIPLLVTPDNLNLPSYFGQQTPLHLALQNEHFTAAGVLLDAGAVVNIPDNTGNIPLAYAVHHKRPQLHVRLLQLMRQQHPAAAGEAALMEPVITAAAWLSRNRRKVVSAARLFAAVMAAWGPSAAADLLQGLLIRLDAKPHHLEKVLLVGWQQAPQDQQRRARALVARLQRLVRGSCSPNHHQQQGSSCTPQDRALRLRLPLALLLNQQAGQTQGHAPGSSAPGSASGASVAPQLAGLSLGPSSSQADAIAAAARRGSLREVAALLAAVAPTQLPAVLLVAAQAAGVAGHCYLSQAALEQFAAMDWQAAACSNRVAPLAGVFRAAVQASAPPPATTVAAAAPAAAAAAPAATTAAAGSSGGSGQQPFCLYSALLDSWAAAGRIVGLELAAQVVEAVEAATTAQADGRAEGHVPY
jgi:ankyrin repeat protein